MTQTKARIMYANVIEWKDYKHKYVSYCFVYVYLCVRGLYVYLDIFF